MQFWRADKIAKALQRAAAFTQQTPDSFQVAKFLSKLRAALAIEHKGADR
jgi:hypothetical protein